MPYCSPCHYVTSRLDQAIPSTRLSQVGTEVVKTPGHFKPGQGVTQSPGLCPWVPQVTSHVKQVALLRWICSFWESVFIKVCIIYCNFIGIFVWMCSLDIRFCVNSLQIMVSVASLKVSIFFIFHFNRLYGKNYIIFPEGTILSINV